MNLKNHRYGVVKQRLIVLSLMALLGTCTATRSLADDNAGLKVAKFDIDATPPIGFRMAYDHVIRTEELGLRCRGIVIIGSGKPIVLCAVDWIGIGNGGQDAFRETLAKAAGTSPNRVAVHTLHQHDAPRCDFTAEQLLHGAGVSDLGPHDGSFARELLKRLSVAVSEAMSKASEVSHIGIGKAVVQDVASNRRIVTDGKVTSTRYTTTRDPKLRALPDGVIDPELNSLTFFNDKTPIAVLSYYACHPQSYYRTGVPSPDFPGIARFMRGQDVPDVLHVHFNGAGGNIGAGKYNDGNKANRLILASRVAKGMKSAYESSRRIAVSPSDVGWTTESVALPVAEHLDADELRANLDKWNTKDYWGSPEQLAWVLRCKDGHKIDIGCLKIGSVRILHMPGELFVEYQLAAKKLRPDLDVMMAAYGEYGAGYIGTHDAYAEGGYETSARASKTTSGAEAILMGAVKTLLGVEDFASELPRIPPLWPESALDSFAVADGFEMQLVASEPLLGSPVEIQWDSAGGLFVCEMRGYSEDQDDLISTIGLLRDPHGDGTFDLRTTFASGLRWPTAIFPYDGGLFVADAPNLYYFKDTNGDDVADTKEVVLTGFGTSNVQGLMNSMRWGLDNRIHIACSSTGGMVVAPNSADKPVNIRGHDIALDPRTRKFYLTTGAAQHGMCFDDWGRKFVSSNSDHIQQVMYPYEPIARNRFMKAPRARVSIAADGPQAEVFRASPVEPWRIVRTRLRVGGKVRGPIEGGGRAAGYFTGATGVTIYRGDAWPSEWKGIAVVGDVGSNLIHRKKLLTSGLQFTAKRIDHESEFITSRDIWFRPAQFANGPDGCLHVIDVCREVIEHPKSLPPEIKKHLDLTSGRDHGRIYRIAPAGHKPLATENLRRAKNERLVDLLAHENAWHRETAARLLIQRNATLIASRLRQVASESGSALARMHAMCVLDGLKELDEPTLMARFLDTHPQVRRHAVRLASDQISPALNARLLSLADDPSLWVRYELAFALGSVDDPKCIDVLAGLIQKDPSDRWMRLAVQSAVPNRAGELFAALVSNAEFWESGGTGFLSSLADQIVRRDDPAEVSLAVTAMGSVPPQANPTILNVAGIFLAAANRKQGAIGKLIDTPALNSMRTAVKSQIADSLKLAMDANAKPAARVRAIDAMRYASTKEVVAPLAALITATTPDVVQQAVMIQLKRFNDPQVSSAIIAAWPALSPRLRDTATEVMFARQDRISELFGALDDGKIKLSMVSRSRLKLAEKSTNPKISERAKSFLNSSASPKRAEVLKRYQSALTIDGDVVRGKAAFKKHCSGCHKVEGVGHEIGPNLAAMKARGAEAILVNVIDPNREVNPQYLNYIVLTHDGESVTGMISSESATTVTLERTQAAKDSLLRTDIAQLKSTGVSLMPEGLEENIDIQTMADIIKFLMNAK